MDYPVGTATSSIAWGIVCISSSFVGLSCGKRRTLIQGVKQETAFLTVINASTGARGRQDVHHQQGIEKAFEALIADLSVHHAILAISVGSAVLGIDTRRGWASSCQLLAGHMVPLVSPFAGPHGTFIYA